jgi:hypothetical protein
MRGHARQGDGGRKKHINGVVSCSTSRYPLASQNAQLGPSRLSFRLGTREHDLASMLPERYRDKSNIRRNFPDEPIAYINAVLRLPYFAYPPVKAESPWRLANTAVRISCPVSALPGISPPVFVSREEGRHIHSSAGTRFVTVPREYCGPRRTKFFGSVIAEPSHRIKRGHSHEKR